MRVFIGVDFADQTQSEITGIQNQLKPYAVSGNWKSQNNLHLTLKFLGEVSTEQLPVIHDTVRTICSSRKAFSLAISNLWSFDGKDSIRVLWLGLTGDLDLLQSLQNKIDTDLQPLGFAAEKRGFAPHVTIGQDIVFKSDLAQIQAELGEIELKSQPIRSLYLFESQEVAGKRVYTKIAEYPLGT